MVVADGSEVILDVQQANYLNENGVVTALNFYNGFVSWGNYTACYPADTDMTNYSTVSTVCSNGLERPLF